MDEIKEYGQVKLDHNNNHKNIFLLSIIGEIEGHENVASGTKATKYEHILPMLAKIEDDQDIDGLLIILNTVGGDVECGLAIAEMIASLSKPTVSLVLGGSHSIGVPVEEAEEPPQAVRAAAAAAAPATARKLRREIFIRNSPLF